MINSASALGSLELARQSDGGRSLPNRAGDWLAQSERDLDQAKASQRDGRDEWACFAAHQSADKAVKALHLHHGQEAWGHVVARLPA